MWNQSRIFHSFFSPCAISCYLLTASTSSGPCSDRCSRRPWRSPKERRSRNKICGKSTLRPSPFVNWGKIGELIGVKFHSVLQEPMGFCAGFQNSSGCRSVLKPSTSWFETMPLRREKKCHCARAAPCRLESSLTRAGREGRLVCTQSAWPRSLVRTVR